jgi:hypothetical protein
MLHHHTFAAAMLHYRTFTLTMDSGALRLTVYQCFYPAPLLLATIVIASRPRPGFQHGPVSPALLRGGSV